MKSVICIDFDGVLNNYTHYDENDLFTPREGARDFLIALSEKYYVVVLTARNTHRVHEWLLRYDMPFYEVTNVKPPAVAYIDDRAICFEGSFNELMREVDDFKTYWEKELES